MMALLMPWRKLQEIKGESFEASFDVWKSKTAQSNLDIMENIQFYHDALQRANKCRQEDPQSFQKEPNMDKHLDQQVPTESHDTSFLTEEDAKIARDNCLACRDVDHGKLALVIAYNIGIFRDVESKGVGRSAKIAKPGDLLQYAQWDAQIKNHVKQALKRRFVVDNTMSILPRAPRMPEAEHGI